MELNSRTWLSEWAKSAILFSGALNTAAILFFGYNSALFFIIFNCAFCFYGVYLIQWYLEWKEKAFLNNFYRHYYMSPILKKVGEYMVCRKWGVFEL